MSVTGNINEVLKQIQLLIKIYGDASFVELQSTLSTARSK